MKVSFPVALIAYGVLALLAAFTLTEPKLRIAVWILLGALAIKSWIAHAAKW